MSMPHLKIRKEIENIESSKDDFCNSLTSPVEGTIFLGGTGGGKTTLIEFLEGKELIVKEKYSNLYLASSSNQINNGPHSVTDRIIVSLSHNGNLYIDTPGFWDTYGEYNQIKNIHAIESILNCPNIRGLKLALVIPKSFIFYEGNRGLDFTNYIKSIRNFIPNFGDQKWLNQAFIIVTKTEERTSTDDAIRAITAAIEENHMEDGERSFFKSLLGNKKVVLFPLPSSSYTVDTPYQNKEILNDILELVEETNYVAVTKQDFRSLDLHISLQGNIVADIMAAKKLIEVKLNETNHESQEYQKDFIATLPTNNFTVAKYKKSESLLEDYFNNPLKFCSPKENSLFIEAMQHLKGVKESSTLLCELDFSLKYLERFIHKGLDIFNAKHEIDEAQEIIGIMKDTWSWAICSTTIFNKFFRSYKEAEASSSQYNLEMLLKNQAATFKYFQLGQNKNVIISNLLDECTTSDQSKLNLMKLASSVENNFLNLLADFIIKKHTTYHEACHIKGLILKTSQIASHIAELSSCKEITMFGVCGIIVDKSVELYGKNFYMIAPIVSVIENQKIVLDGENGVNYTILANPGMNGNAGETGKSAGSFFGYCYSIDDGVLTVTANGGKGADGQNGGAGIDGRKGNPASEASMYDLPHTEQFLHEYNKTAQNTVASFYWYQITKFSDAGTPGKNGRNGKSGGEGGKGGLAGIVDFEIFNNKDHFISIAEKGANGRNGPPGAGGEGGEHGDAIQGTWYFPKCSGYISILCWLNKPAGYWAEGKEPAHVNSKLPRSSNGEQGSVIPVIKSIQPEKVFVGSVDIVKEKIRKDYIEFLFKDSNSNSILDFYKNNYQHFTGDCEYKEEYDSCFINDYIQNVPQQDDIV